MIRNDRKMISIITPVYNEQELIENFYLEIKEVLEKIKYDYEIIFIDDGSSDNSLALLQKIADKEKNAKVIVFSRNFGHMKALSAGIDFASGDAVITIDSDLQHPPQLIPQLLKKWEDGFEIVNTIREKTKEIPFFKNYSAVIFYWLLNRITKIKFPYNSADFRLIDRCVVDTIKNMQEHSRFLRGLIGWVGFRQTSILYRPQSRVSGKTKYSLFKMVSFAIDGITSFSSFPLRISTYFGLIVVFFSSIYIICAIYLKILNRTVSGWASVLVVVLFMGGVQLVFLGIIGEYLARVYEETKRRPPYIIKKKIGF